LRIDLFEGIVAQDRIASTVSPKVEDHLCFSLGLGFPDEVAHSVLETLDIG
jgi:hypothetical protein